MHATCARIRCDASRLLHQGLSRPALYLEKSGDHISWLIIWKWVAHARNGLVGPAQGSTLEVGSHSPKLWNAPLLLRVPSRTRAECLPESPRRRTVRGVYWAVADNTRAVSRLKPFSRMSLSSWVPVYSYLLSNAPRHPILCDAVVQVQVATALSRRGEPTMPT